MRKKTQTRLFDNIFWYLIYMLPLIAFLILLAKNGATDFSIVDAFNSIGLNMFSDNVVLDNLSSIFGVDGVLPTFLTTDMLIYLTYFIMCFIIHMFVDFLLFIPRIAMHWMDKIGGEN